MSGDDKIKNKQFSSFLLFLSIRWNALRTNMQFKQRKQERATKRRV